MPYRRTKGARTRRVRLRKGRRRYRKQGARKNRARGSPTTTLIRQPAGVPDRILVKLKYGESLSFTQLPGVLGTVIYRGNGPAEPLYPTFAGIPDKFAEWSTFYGKYCCLGSKMDIISMVNAPAVYNNVVVIHADNDPNIYLTADDLEEQPYTKRSVVRMGSAGIGQNRLSMYMDTARIKGRAKRTIMTEDNLNALTNTIPNDQWFWHVSNYVPGGMSQSLVVRVNITYYICFYQRTRPLS